MNPRQVLDKLIERANIDNSARFVSSNIRDIRDPLWWTKVGFKVGELVQALPADERAALAKLVPDTTRTVFFGYGANARPERPTRQRVRGPVSFGR